MNTLLHKEFNDLGDKYGNLIFFKLFMDQPVVVVRGYQFIKVRNIDASRSVEAVLNWGDIK